MATKTSVVMQTTDQAQNKSSRSITYIDPNASNSDIKNFIEGLNGLTHQTLAAARRVDSTDILDATEKLPRNLKMSLQDPQTTHSPTEITSVIASQITADTEDPLNIFFTNKNIDGTKINVEIPENGGYYYVTWIVDGNGWTSLMLVKLSAEVMNASSIVINVPEDDTYAEQTLTLTITAE